MGKKGIHNLFKCIKFTLFCAAIFSHLGPVAWASQVMRKNDLDGDGTKEANVYYEGNKIMKIVMHKNHDGKTDSRIYYRAGFRDYAELDSNFDGIIDTVILYYFTGIPASIAVDRNGDSKPDRWTYFQNGIIYKREWDRNFDGIPDYRIRFSVKADYRMDVKTEMQAIVKEYDNNNDGFFEKTVKTKKRAQAKRLSSTAGSLSEVTL